MSQVSKAPKCSDSQSAKKSSINNSSMVCEKYFKTFKLIPNQKLPTSEWAKDKPNTHLWKHENISTLEDFKIPKTKGIPCGKRNDIVVVDLDFYDKYDTEEEFEDDMNSIVKHDLYKAYDKDGTECDILISYSQDSYYVKDCDFRIRIGYSNILYGYYCKMIQF